MYEALVSLLCMRRQAPTKLGGILARGRETAPFASPLAFCLLQKSQLRDWVLVLQRGV